MRTSPPKLRERGAALLTAMLTVTLVATFAAAAMWQQWRAVEVEAAERSRVQSAWVLVGASDWARLILREDGRAGGADHLQEPWAIPLEEARLSTFLAADKNIASDALEGLPDAFMSGRIIDGQSKLNVTNLVVGGKPVPTAVASFTKLFELIGVPTQEVAVLVANLQRATAGLAPSNPTGATNPAAGAAVSGTTPSTGTQTTSSMSDSDSAGAPLMPQQLEQLTWLGLSASTVAAITPYVTVLPVSTPLNINTATAEALSASLPSLDLASAKRLVAQRTNRFFSSLADAQKLMPESSAQFAEGQQSVSTSYFELHARLRLDKIWVEEHSLLRRDGMQVSVVWRNRGAGATFTQAKP
ncbi:type II secretion system minor pseudopilin GspK [Variovorax sp. J22R133]|uniref:type II secretion system minor pseudopilin GspK n=1 Tax=Variovorax brevis TaxID=3053503 RepID=UPI00257791C9|nr:type II secretion system minor pseudopilin GspK [Variovorax sp. J22R133]MDM0114495.1 type II secretion system minor pseudopilin GspK [Variovorax sp. J22R133]